LANDYGKALHSGAHLSALRRTRSGAFNIADAWNLSTLIDEISVQRINWTAKETASIDESL
jgi:tRNA pseudouridine55 synthase